MGGAGLAMLSVGVAAGVAGCGGGGSSGGGANNQRGPANATAFHNTTIQINPTLRFLAGNSVEYTNTEAGSPFPPSATALTGTYTYNPSADFRTGTLTLQLSGAVNVSLALSQFQTSGANVTGFRATYNGTPYVATVTSGQLPSAPEPGGGPGTGDQPATDIPAGIHGTYEMTFAESAAGSGITDGSSQSITIGADSLNLGGKVLSSPVFRGGNTAEWIFKDGTVEYALSLSTGTQINEINVTGAAGTPFYGRYRIPVNDGTIVLLGNGNLPPGTTFTLGMVSSELQGGSEPAGVPVFTSGELATFTVSESGALSIAGLTLPFVESSSGILNYLQVLSVADFSGNSASLTLDPTTNVPISATVGFARNGDTIIYSFN